jgi:hypothetical protein
VVLGRSLDISWPELSVLGRIVDLLVSLALQHLVQKNLCRLSYGL